MKHNNEALEQHSQQLEYEIDKLNRKLENIVAQHVPAVDSKTKEQEIFLSPEEESINMQARVDEQYGYMRSSLLTENTDPYWASDVQASLDQVLQADDLQGVQVNAVDCRSTLCQVNLATDSVESAETSIRMLGHSDVVGGGQGFFRFDESEYGGGELTLIISKAGHDLPLIQ